MKLARRAGSTSWLHRVNGVLVKKQWHIQSLTGVGVSVRLGRCNNETVRTCYRHPASDDHRAPTSNLGCPVVCCSSTTYRRIYGGDTQSRNLYKKLVQVMPQQMIWKYLARRLVELFRYQDRYAQDSSHY